MDKEQLMEEAHYLHLAIMDRYRASTGAMRERLARISSRTALRHRRRRIAWIAVRGRESTRESS